MLKSVRARLAFWHILVAMLLVVSFGFVLYFSISNNLYHEVDLTLQAKSVTISSELDFVNGHPVISGEEINPNMALPLQILDLQGGLLVQSPSFATKPFPFTPITRSQVLSQGSILETISVDERTPLRVLTVFIKGESQDPSVFLQVGTSLGGVQGTLARLRFWLFLTAPILLLLLSLGSFLLTHHLLRPLKNMAQTAEQIGEKNLNERLVVANPEDEIGHLAKAFNGMFDRLQRAFENQKRFVSDASHELRTPLTVLRAKLELALRKTRSTEEYQSVVQSALTQSERLSQLVEHLLLLARADAGGWRPDFHPVSLDKLCLELSQEFLPLAQQKKISLKTSCAGSILVQGNEALLYHLMMDLLDNAIKYTPEGGKVLVAVSREDQRARLAVSDTGIGILAEDLSHIFDRFYRVDKARSQLVSGIGLGLSIAKEIVTVHRGEIFVESTPGQGSTFMVYLPLSEEVGPPPP